VLDAIHGADPGDPDSVSQPFLFDAGRKVSELRVGYLTKEFGEKAEDDRAREWQALDAAALEAIRGLGVDPKPVALPDFLADDMMIILTAEAGAAFDTFSRSTLDDQMVRQTADAWPNVFRQAQLVPAVDYLRAMRIRTLMMADLRKLMTDWDVIVAPTFAGSTVAVMNLAGLPQVVLPSGFRQDGTPVSITFCGGLYGEGPALQLARAYQEATGWHRRTPSAFGPGASPPATEAFLTQKKND
jgi:Asp-tRNA(Asn)/Glu-tRNA(Gln) amidotransferase A subunit family amidase